MGKLFSPLYSSIIMVITKRFIVQLGVIHFGLPVSLIEITIALRSDLKIELQKTFVRKFNLRRPYYTHRYLTVS